MIVSRQLHAYQLGRVPYRDAWALQQRLVKARKADTIPDTVLLLEHDPVVTLGRAGSRDSLLHDEAALASRGVDLVHSDRGGDATYHGPGQLVVYPILDLRPDRKDVRRFVRGLEQMMIDTCADFGVQATRRDGDPGIWLREPDRKIGAIGARFSRWVSHHGVALNVNTHMAHFGLIIPCGIRNGGVTSLQMELGHRVELDAVTTCIAEHLARIFGRALSWPSADTLTLETAS
ncbi:MAG: lipoyl(octanoyl) transferase [Bradymonadia bacterium]